MSPSLILITTVLIVLSLALLGVLSYFIYKPAKELYLRSKSYSDLTKRTLAVQQVDLLIEDGNLLQAVPLLKEILFLDTPRSAEYLTSARELNQDFLGRVILLSERLGARLSNLESLESLLVERTELLQLLFKARMSFETLLGKRETDGKALPQWSKDEFKRKEEEISLAVSNNMKALLSEINATISSLQQGSSGEYLIH